MIYADCNATVPVSLAHVQKISEQFFTLQGNASSPHIAGRRASVAIFESRKNIAKVTSFDVGDVIFVSGGTEANNLGTIGVLNQIVFSVLNDQKTTENNEPVHVLVSALEHPCVGASLYEFTLKINTLYKNLFPENLIHLEVVPYPQCLIAKEYASRIKKNTKLISFMAANNESGWMFPAKEFADELHEARWNLKKSDFFGVEIGSNEFRQALQSIHFHCDTVQAFGKIKNTFSLGMDSASICAHKLGGISGIGALLIRKGRKFLPFFQGGMQERGRRAGTENLMGILSLGLICETLEENFSHWQSTTVLVDLVRQGLRLNIWNENLPEQPNDFNLLLKDISRVHCALPNTLFLQLLSSSKNKVPKINVEDILVQLDFLGICISTGSACSSAVSKPSVVLKALGFNDLDARESLRISFGSASLTLEAQQIADSLSKFFQKI
jgi:cysteine desulfurase